MHALHGRGRLCDVVPYQPRANVYIHLQGPTERDLLVSLPCGSTESKGFIWSTGYRRVPPTTNCPWSGWGVCYRHTESVLEPWQWCRDVDKAIVLWSFRIGKKDSSLWLWMGWHLVAGTPNQLCNNPLWKKYALWKCFSKCVKFLTTATHFEKKN
jgi:hypothetical protein